jgi:hypothetical protein
VAAARAKNGESGISAQLVALLLDGKAALVVEWVRWIIRWTPRGDMENLIAGSLTIELVMPEPRGPIQMVWRGKSNDRAPSKTLTPYFATVLSAAAERGAPLELHFEQIDHFNSSTITSIIQLIQDARSSGVRLVLVYDKALKWQKLSFDALRVFERDGYNLELRSI